MNSNAKHITNTELINGYAIVDNNFSIITANEALYKFIGIATHYTIIDIIHQVDLDDFIDVANNLRINQKKVMTLRMKRVDNSYRWVLVDIERKRISANEDTEYLELNISDIIAMRSYNESLQNTIQSFRHILSMDDELLFIYDYSTDKLVFYDFVDNEMRTLYEVKLEEYLDKIINDGEIPSESIPVIQKLINDINNGKSSYTYKFKANMFNRNTSGFSDTIIKGTTIFQELLPVKSVGSMKLIDSNETVNSKKTYEIHNENNRSDLESFCFNNVNINPNVELAIIIFEIDNLNEYEKEKGVEAASKIKEFTRDTILKVIEYRGVFCEIENNRFVIIIKDTNYEVSLRAFLEYIRTRISWRCRLYDVDYKIKFSIGIGRYPENGTDWDIITKKISKAISLAKTKGGNRYIIYKEELHGEIEK